MECEVRHEMNTSTKCITLFAALCFLALGVPLQAPAATIETASFVVEFDAESHRFSLHHQPTQRTFVRSGMFTNGDGKATITAVEHPVLGKAQAIEIVWPNGNRDRIAIYPKLDFVLFSSTLRNNGTEPLIVDQLTPFTVALDVGLSPNDLRVSGTRSDLAAPGGEKASHAFAAVVDPVSRRGVVGGWLTHERASGMVLTPVSADKKDALMKPRLDYGRLWIMPGAEAATETFALGWFEDARLGLEAYADAIKQVYNIRLPRPPIGHCTWYMEKNQFSCSEAKLPELVEVAARELKPFGFEFLQIDDFWQTGQHGFGGSGRQFLNVNQGAFPSGMKAAAERIKSAGLTPGLWLIPFAGNSQDPYFAAHPDWFAKRASTGKPFDTYWGGSCLDMTHPPAREYLRSVVKQMAGDWGYSLFKMDGLYTGCAVDHADKLTDDLGGAVLANPDKTQIEAYRDGFRLFREAAGPRAFLLGCTIVQNMRSFSGAFGLVDAMRVGPDTGGVIGAAPASRLWFLNGRVWWNDPDVVIVRPDKGSLNWARRNATWAAIAGQLFYNSDWLPDLPAERLEVLKRCMPSHGLTTARPVDVFETWMPQIWLLTDTRGSVRRDIVAIYKWWGDTRPFAIATERLGLPAAKEYVAFDFWANQFLPPFKDTLAITLERDSCSVLAVRPAADHPQLLSTSRHVTQGIADVAGEVWDAATKTLSGVSTVVGNDSYELRIAMPAGGIGQAPAVVLSAEDARAGVATRIARDGQNLRVILTSQTSRAVRWSIRFGTR